MSIGTLLLYDGARHCCHTENSVAGVDSGDGEGRGIFLPDSFVAAGEFITDESRGSERGQETQAE